MIAPGFMCQHNMEGTGMEYAKQTLEAERGLAVFFSTLDDHTSQPIHVLSPPVYV